MAKSKEPKSSKPPKAPKAPKAAKAPKEVDSAANVGPVDGTLESQPDEAAKAVKPAKAAPKADKHKTRDELINHFATVEKFLLATNLDKKLPRQLRWALRALDAAKDAAVRHVHHNG